MTKGDRLKRDRNRVAVDGPWLPLPCGFLASRACAELSPLACKMLVFLLGQLRAGGSGNGRADAHPDRLAAHGFTSRASATAALRELIDAGLVAQTAAGRKGASALFGVTLLPFHANPAGLDHGPGLWTAHDWRERAGAEAPPTLQHPAEWTRPRSGEKRDRTPRSGTESPECPPAAGQHSSEMTPCSPAAGQHQGGSAGNPPPQRVTPIDSPSARPKRPRAVTQKPVAQPVARRIVVHVQDRPPVVVQARVSVTPAEPVVVRPFIVEAST